MRPLLPLVSIIIPTYNYKHWIAEAIDSILAQPYPSYEVIVVDDGSTDGTGEFLRERYAHRIHYHYQENRGRGAARNVGLKLAQGEFIQFFDADDIMEPDALRSRVDFLYDNPQYGAAYSPAVQFWDGNSQDTFPPHNRWLYCSGDLMKLQIHTPFLWTIAVLFRREWAERVDGMDEDLKSNEDWHFWLKLCAVGVKFAFIDGPPVARYRMRHNNPQSSVAIHLLSGVETLTRIKPILESRKDYKSLRLDQAIGRYQYGYGYALLKEGRRGKGISQIFRSLRHNRESLTSKLLQIVLSLFVPPDQLEATFGQIHSLLKSTRGV